VALETKLNDYKKKHPNTSNASGSGSDKNSKRGKSKNNKSQDNSNNNTDGQAWKTKHPKDKDKHKSKKIDDRTYWWCPRHKSWCMHKAKECRLAANKGNNNHNNPGSTPTPGTVMQTPSSNDSTANRLRLTSAVTALQEEEE
jgi:hypothetical protein